MFASGSSVTFLRYLPEPVATKYSPARLGRTTPISCHSRGSPKNGRAASTSFSLRRYVRLPPLRSCQPCSQPSLHMRTKPFTKSRSTIAMSVAPLLANAYARALRTSSSYDLTLSHSSPSSGTPSRRQYSSHTSPNGMHLNCSNTIILRESWNVFCMSLSWSFG